MSASPKKPRRPASDPAADFRQLEQKLKELGQVSRNEPVPAPVSEPERRYDDLMSVAVSLTSSLDLKDILDRIVDGIIRVTRCERAFLMLREPDGTFSTFTGRTRDNREWDERNAREISRTIVGRVVDTHEPFIEADLEHVTSGSIHQQQILAAVCLPLAYKDELVGVIYADSSRILPRFQESDRAVLGAFGAQASLAVENARRHGEVKFRHDRLEEQNLLLRKQLVEQFTMMGMITRNKRMLEIFEAVEKIAPRDTVVLIEGESGTGKELLARAIHEKSPRRDRPFAAQNCASMPAGLVDSTLFGHRKGAFTGADYDKPGLFEVANGGTLFLDEIGDMPLEIQPKLLRVLEEHEVTRLGEEGRTRPVDVRIVAATNMDLNSAVAAGRFRFDLYHRLNIALISLPPLRERKEDIVPLAEHFLKRFAQEEGQPTPRLSREARALILAADWPGNVRELRNAMELGYAYQDESHTIHTGALERFFRRVGRETISDQPTADALGTQMDHFEERVIRRVLAENAHNVTAAAKALAISRQQLHLKIKKYGISTKAE